MTNKRIGNRRNFELSNHRLSKQSLLQALTELEKAVVSQNFLLFGTSPSSYGKGPLGGTVSRWFYSTQDTFGANIEPVVRFTVPGYLAYAPYLDGDVNSADFAARVVLYDPASPAQAQTQVDLSALVGQLGFVWWRRDESEVSVRSEAQWVSPTGEQFTPTETLIAERVEFVATSTAPHPVYNYDNGWRVLAVITAWAGDYPYLKFVNFLDSNKVTNRMIKLPAYRPEDEFMDATIPPVANGDGIVALLKRVVDQLWMLHDANVDIPVNGENVVQSPGLSSWYRRPRYGTRQIDDTLDNLLARMGAVEAGQSVTQGVLYAAATPIGSGINPVVLVPDAESGLILNHGPVVVTRTATGTYQYDFPTAVDTAAAVPVASPNYGDHRTENIIYTWSSSTRLIVKFVQASDPSLPILGNRTHNLIVYGALA